MNTLGVIRRHPSLRSARRRQMHIVYRFSALVILWKAEGVLWKLLRQRSFAIEFDNRSDIFLISP